MNRLLRSVSVPLGRARLVSAALLAAAALATPAQTQQTRFALPISAQLGLPQGEFANNVAVAGGFGLGGLFALASEFALRGEFDFSVYGSDTRRLPVGGGGFGLSVDVTTTNAIVGGAIGAQLGMPGPRVRPYIGGMIGFSNFTTKSAINGRDGNDEPFEAKTHASDNALAKSAIGGIYFPIGTGGTVFDLGAKYTWNGESVRYLTRGDVTEDQNGNLVLTIRESRADLLTLRIGVTIRLGGGGMK